MLGLRIVCSDTSVAGSPGSTVQVNLPQPTFTGATTPTFQYVDSMFQPIQDRTSYPVTVLATSTVLRVTVYGTIGIEYDSCIISVTVTG